MNNYKYLKYKHKYTNLKKIQGGHKPCIVIINKYLNENNNVKNNEITLNYFLSNYKKNKPYYFFYNNNLELYINENKLNPDNKLNSNNIFNLQDNINIENEKNNDKIIKFINNKNKNDEYIFDQIICIYEHNSENKSEFYYENFYEHDETSSYK